MFICMVLEVRTGRRNLNLIIASPDPPYCHEISQFSFYIFFRNQMEKWWNIQLRIAYYWHKHVISKYDPSDHFQRIPIINDSKKILFDCSFNAWHYCARLIGVCFSLLLYACTCTHIHTHEQISSTCCRELNKLLAVQLSEKRN